MSTSHTLPRTGAPTELGRYTLPNGTVRHLIGQRIEGSVRLVDAPLAGRGRRYVIERGLEQDGYAALLAITEDYLTQAEKLGTVPALPPVDRYLEHLK